MVDLLTNSDNWRALAVLAAVLCGYFRLNMSFEKKFGFLNKKVDALDKKIDDKFGILDKKIDGVESSLLKAMDEKIDTKLSAFYAQLKANDFAHLNNTIEALTFTLEKNKFLEKEDKEYIDSRLDR